MANELQKAINELKRRRNDIDTAIRVLEREMSIEAAPRRKPGRRKKVTKQAPSKD